jgi:hypothetical protein
MSASSETCDVCHIERTFGEVLVHDVEALLVDVQILVMLQVVNGDLPNFMSAR